MGLGKVLELPLIQNNSASTSSSDGSGLICLLQQDSEHVFALVFVAYRFEKSSRRCPLVLYIIKN